MEQAFATCNRSFMKHTTLRNTNKSIRIRIEVVIVNIKKTAQSHVMELKTGSNNEVSDKVKTAEIFNGASVYYM